MYHTINTLLSSIKTNKYRFKKNYFVGVTLRLNYVSVEEVAYQKYRLEL